MTEQWLADVLSGPEGEVLDRLNEKVSELVLADVDNGGVPSSFEDYVTGQILPYAVLDEDGVESAQGVVLGATVDEWGTAYLRVVVPLQPRPDRVTIRLSEGDDS